MAALYPTSVTTQLFQVQARTQSTLTADVDAVTTTWLVVSTAGWPDKGFVVCENETAYYSAKTSTSLTVQRGFAGTAVSHTTGKAVKLAVVAETTNRIIEEIIAIQGYVGISGSAGTTTITYKLNNLWSFSQAGSTQVTNLNAQYLGGLTSGQITTTNVANLSGISGVKFIPNSIEVMPQGWDLNNNNPPTLIDIVGTSVTPRLQYLYFGSTDVADLGPIKFPSEYNGGTIEVTFMYSGSTASLTNNLGLQIATAGSGASYNPTYGTPIWFGQLNASGSTGILKLFTTQILGASLGLTNSKLNFIRFCGGTTNNALIHNFGMSWSRG